MKSKILIVDNERTILEQMRLALDPHYTVFTATLEDEAATTYAREKPPVVIVDLSLNTLDTADLGGIRLLEHILSIDPSTRTILVTGNTDNNVAARAVHLGAFDYFIKPIRLDELKVTIGRAFHLHRLLQTAPPVDQALGKGFYGVVGASKAMKGIWRSIDQLAFSDVPVLIRGECGTGKQTIARAIHCKSSRRNYPFVVIKCGGIPESDLETEIFGQGEEAFAGARTLGQIELAHGGTLYLGEIGELTPRLQGRLLKYLQHQNFKRVSARRPMEVKTRIVAATSRDLKKCVESHAFCEELYFCLQSATMVVPSLRERREDIIPLAEHFLKMRFPQKQEPPIVLSPEAEGALLMHPWLGNVRELKDLINRSVVLTSRTVLRPSDLGFTLDRIPTDVNLKAAKSAIEMGFVTKALSRNYGVISRAARELGISRVNLYELIEKYNIRLQEFKILKPADKSQTIKPEVLVN